MNGKDIDVLVNQIRYILLNKPLPKELWSETKEIQELQEGIKYLSGCLIESDAFLKSLCAGTLDVEPPGRHNVLAGNLKELHSVLKFLTWQTEQVAGGDYQQRVDFLGEFSKAFNTMIHQLEEREIALKEKSGALGRSMNLLISIMDVQEEWVMVISKDGEVIYANNSAAKLFYDPQNHRSFCGKPCPLLDKLKEMSISEDQTDFEYQCDLIGRVFCVKVYPLEWGGKQACAHYISDITKAKEEKENLSEMAYKDPLTGIYNRRHCMETIETYMGKTGFTMALLDIDGLKYVNDTYGHVAGDEYIQEIVRIVRHHIRESDTFCRIGGDEFVILLKNCPEALAQKKLEEVSESIASHESSYPMSVSFGATWIPTDTDMSPEEVITASDGKMYDYKSTHKKPRPKVAKLFSLPDSDSL